MERLPAVDASFLAQERGSAHMHVGAVAIFEAPAPAYEELVGHIESRLHLVPRFRQKLAFPRFQPDRPFWVDDPFFNLRYHVRHTALPAPGAVEQLQALTARTFSQRLDRTKPLWELLMVEGLADGRFAVISKNHHALVDGIAGMDLARLLFDTSPTPAAITPDEAMQHRAWMPRPEPSEAELIAAGLREAARAPLDLLDRLLRVLEDPRKSAAEELRGTAEGVGEVIWAVLNPAPETPLNVPIGPHRRVHWLRRPLADFKTVKDALGGTVNDVLLTVVTGALRRWLPTRGTRPEGLELRALVPVSTRQPDDSGQLGNRLVPLRGSLPVYCADPVACLALVREGMTELKDSKQALGAKVIAALQDLAPPRRLADASRINFSTRLFNLLATNIPGPQFPLYLLGRELESLVPVAFLAENHALAIAIMSYNGNVDFGLIADYDAVPDLDQLGGYLEEALDELLAAAREASAAAPRRRRGGASKDGHGARSAVPPGAP